MLFTLRLSLSMRCLMIYFKKIVFSALLKPTIETICLSGRYLIRSKKAFFYTFDTQKKDALFFQCLFWAKISLK